MIDFPAPDVIAVVITNGTQSKLLQPEEDESLSMNGLRAYARALRKRNPDYEVHIVRYTASEIVKEQA